MPASGQAGVAQLMAGRLGQPGPGSGAVENLVQAGRRQRLAPPRALQHHEQAVGAGVGRPFDVQIGRRRGEEPAKHRDQPLMAALALGNEHPPGRHLQVFPTQPKHLAAAQPASTIASAIARSRHVRSAASRAST
jgi:hypothetical protein